MVNAYILIQTEVGKAAAVAKSAAQIKGVLSAEDVTGPYDVIVRAEAKNVDDLGKLVVARIQGVEGITRTLTCPVVEGGPQARLLSFNHLNVEARVAKCAHSFVTMLEIAGFEREHDFHPVDTELQPHAMVLDIDHV